MVVESHSYVKGLYLYHFESSIPSQKVSKRDYDGIKKADNMIKIDRIN